MDNDVKKFYDYISSNANARKELNAKIEDDIKTSKESRIEEWIVLEAKKLGYEFSVDDLTEYEKQKKPNSEKIALDEDELDNVAGGSICACVGGGYGESGGSNDGFCGCLLVGGGECSSTYKDAPRATRCFCVGGGGGESKN